LQRPDAHTYGEQFTLPPLTQLPKPSQVYPKAVLLLHMPPQAVPTWRWQAPAPLHTPVWPQVDGASASQSFAGSVPVGVGPQTPSMPLPFSAAEHA
jgi:hypothetical protein